jgi:ribosomal-protein-alanine acetyltransferase
LSNGTHDNEPDIVVRLMSAEDIDAITRLEAEIFPDPWPEQSFRDIVGAEDWTCLLAHTTEAIAGYACIFVSAGEMHLANIAVAASFRRKSVATRLVNRILDVAAQRRCEMILLEVRVSNKGARAFYEKEGFASLYTRPRYYRKPVEDALVMVRYLN